MKTTKMDILASADSTNSFVSIPHSVGPIKRFFFFESRLESFRDLGWVHRSGPCDAEKMAAAGFYKLNAVDDHVNCAFCDKKLCGWEAQDDPFGEHRKFNPQCLFAQIGKREPDLDVRELILLARFQLNTYLVSFGQQVELIDYS